MTDAHPPRARRRDVLKTLAAAGAATGALAGPAAALEPTCCPVLELRQYTLHAGRRDELIDLFDRSFIAPQEAEGIRVVGQFRDRDDPERFVWLRGFTDLDSRRPALAAFYGGPVWKAHREAANATMLDSDNVLLLRPLRPDTGFNLAARRRGRAYGLVTATIWYLDADEAEAFGEFFTREMAPALVAAGARSLGAFVTHPGPNSFPALPVREREHVLVWFAGFDDDDAHARFVEHMRGGPDCREHASPAIFRQLARKPERLRLDPTSASLLGA